MSRKRVKQYLMLLCVLGLVGVAAGSGTFASFNAQTTNAGNTFATGTLTLGNGLNSSTTTCWSSDNASNTQSCSAVFDAVSWQPGDSAAKYEVTLENGGSVNGTLSLFAPSACVPSSITPSGANHTFNGTADPCAGIKVNVQEIDGPDPNTAGTVGNCLFPVSATPCDTTTGTALSSLPTSGTPLALGSLLSDHTKRYFQLTVIYPASTASDNDYQATQAAFDLTWKLVQS